MCHEKIRSNAALISACIHACSNGLQDDRGGRVEAQWSAAGACGNVSWPTLEAVVVAGLNRTVNASSLALQARGPAPTCQGFRVLHP